MKFVVLTFLIIGLLVCLFAMGFMKAVVNEDVAIGVPATFAVLQVIAIIYVWMN